jgi:hypothetical protein
MSYCHLGVPWRQTEDFLNDIGSMNIVSRHYHSQTLLNEDLSKFKSWRSMSIRNSTNSLVGQNWMNSWLGPLDSIREKSFVRKRSEQNFLKMMSIMKKARLNFEVKQLDHKLQIKLTRPISEHVERK